MKLPPTHRVMHIFRQFWCTDVIYALNTWSKIHAAHSLYMYSYLWP